MPRHIRLRWQHVDGPDSPLNFTTSCDTIFTRYLHLAATNDTAERHIKPDSGNVIEVFDPSWGGLLCQKHCWGGFSRSHDIHINTRTLRQCHSRHLSVASLVTSYFTLKRTLPFMKTYWWIYSGDQGWNLKFSSLWMTERLPHVHQTPGDRPLPVQLLLRHRRPAVWADEPWRPWAPGEERCSRSASLAGPTWRTGVLAVS